jgi:hypothetical protein
MSENISPAKIVPSAPKIVVPAEALDAIAGSLLPKNSVGIASVEFYEAALREVGRDPEALSFAETVEVTRRLYAISAEFRRDRADVAKTEREKVAAEARAKRDAEKAKRLVEERAKLEAKLAALSAK